MIILKIGGGAAINLDAVAQDVKTLRDRPEFEQLVIVNGANAVRDRIAQEMNRPTKTITSPSGVSSVYTDAAAMEVFVMAYAGIANKTIVSTLNKSGVPAVGLSGVDGMLWQAKRKKALYSQEGTRQKLITDSYTGKITQVNTKLLEVLITNGFVPVLCPPAISETYEMVNVDNDTAVTLLAKELHADTIISLFEAPGFLKDPDNPDSVLPRLTQRELEMYAPSARGRMKKKLMGAVHALENGVTTIYWGDGRVEQPISRLLEGNGTIINSQTV